ncbi:polysaccharide biosynthesis tyrosine autokinase [Anaerostipes faecalis]|uniref:polysaccharide biosynthesis tyrosine autokinase n=1 Tax=Anaerostipes faecalis TaxID=2738446 RepID=UPI003F110337
MQSDTENRDLIDLTVVIDDLWRGIRRFGIGILLLMILFGGLFLVKEKRDYIPKYQAYSSFVVKTKSNYGYSESYYNRTTAEQLSKTFPYILTSGALNRVVAESLGKETVPAVITAESMADSAIFTIRAEAKEPQLAYDVLQAVITNYPKVAQYIIGDTELIQMDESGVPENPVNQPAYRSSLMKGALLGGMLGILLVFLYVATRHTVRREEDLQGRMNIACLGKIPMIRFKKRSRKKKLPVLMDQKECADALGETFRSVRTKLLCEMKEQECSKILITSAAAGEGKTTTAVNLALSLAKKGKKVVLIDADLRNPSVAEACGLGKTKTGLADVLKESAELEQVLIPYKETSLTILPGSTPVSNPIRLLGREQMQKLLDRLAKSADYVIVDAPPSGVVSDASLLAQKIPSVVYVVRQDYCGLDQIAAGVERIAETGAKIYGYVLNGIRAGITGYGYGYGYGYGRYGYHRYGYGSSYGKGKEKSS